MSVGMSLVASDFINYHQLDDASTDLKLTMSIVNLQPPESSDSSGVSSELSDFIASLTKSESASGVSSGNDEISSEAVSSDENSSVLSSGLVSNLASSESSETGSSESGVSDESSTGALDTASSSESTSNGAGTIIVYPFALGLVVLALL